MANLRIYAANIFGVAEIKLYIYRINAENKMNGSYIYEHKDWPHFYWNESEVSRVLALVRHRQGRLLGYLQALGFIFKNETSFINLTEDVLKSSEIEGEVLDREQVRSSIARHLGVKFAGMVPTDRHVEGVVEMTLDATGNFKKPLSKDRLFGWHSALFPSGRSGMQRIVVGKWRDGRKGPMQVVSGILGREKVHFEAPAAPVLEREMGKFLKWFNSGEKIDPLLKSAIAHLWFVTIHPFQDGNGRIARAIADMQLARSDGDSRRFYSMSSQIRLQRKTYYQTLENTQKGNLDITVWLLWYFDCLDRAFRVSEAALKKVEDKTKFWDHHLRTKINERQRAMINKLFDGFTGKLTSVKWAKMNKCSADTALRDIQDLIRKRILKKEKAGGRSTSYYLLGV